MDNERLIQRNGHTLTNVSLIEVEIEKNISSIMICKQGDGDSPECACSEVQDTGSTSFRIWGDSSISTPGS